MLLTFPVLIFDFCLLPFDLFFPLGVGAALQERQDVAPEVVQLVAIGPGQKGKNQQCSATGFLVNEEGYILTNAHVVEDARRCLANSPGAKILAKLATGGGTTAAAFSCDVVAMDDAHDLAILRTERVPRRGADERPVIFARLEPEPATEGTPVAVAGHPAFAWQPVTQSGRIVRRAILRLSGGDSQPTEVLVLDIPLRTGNSGSPVFLPETGAVIGIVERQDAANRSQSVAVSIRHAIELLDRHGVGWHRIGP